MEEYAKLKMEESTAMSLLEFTHLGEGEVAYIKPLHKDEAYRLFPALEEIEDDSPLYSLHAADGTPLMLTDSRAEALADAIDNDLEPLSVH
ncbi:MAG: DUF1150 domain-containing protein [Hyphomicrobiaceae bacterium]|nr:DUF1150 domain-containing protein [Hyphomicrobiaceae bacterium]